MGWTAATGRLELPGLFAFGILFFWQLPHFAAISLYLEEDFRRARLPVLASTYGRRTARGFVLLFGLLLIAFSLLAQPLGLAGGRYTLLALAFNAVWLLLLRGALRAEVDESWARQIFAYSLIYLPLLITALILTAS
jgi:protoheme IX farnesyltransferase